MNNTPGTLVVHNNSIFAMGGEANSPPMRGNEIFNSPDGTTWEAFGSAPWRARTAMYAVSFRGYLWVIGGQGHYATSGDKYDDVWRTADGTTWEEVLASGHGQFSRRTAGSSHKNLGIIPRRY